MKRLITKATITRPKLARLLLAAGYTVTPTQSIWSPTRTEWEYELDETSAKIVLDYYTTIGKRPPQIVTKFLQDQEMQA